METVESGSPRPSRTPNVRLQKYLAACGLGSRRACETLIADGQVTVNGRLVCQQGVCVDPDVDRIEVGGRSIGVERKLYLLLNKPRDVLCTSHDTHGRRTFLDFFPGMATRLFSVGRLDRASEGLLIVTNDGDLALALTHPRHEVPKTYHVRLNGLLSPEALSRLRQGILSEGQTLRAERVVLRSSRDQDYEVILNEGRKRQIRRMVEAMGLKVLRLKRVAIGSLTIAGLRSGTWRHLSEAERRSLMEQATGSRCGEARMNPDMDEGEE
ncbi:MAG: pseudouridine synthase [bacterium]